MSNLTTMIPVLLQQEEAAGAVAALFGGVAMLVWIALMAVFIIAGWKVFVKAGQPGWAILVPFYNLYIMVRIAGKPGWWFLLMLIPIANIVVAAIVCMDFAKAFGQSAVFGIVFLFLLGGIGILILGFGSARYQGPALDTPV